MIIIIIKVFFISHIQKQGYKVLHKDKRTKQMQKTQGSKFLKIERIREKSTSYAVKKNRNTNTRCKNIFNV